MVTFERLSGDTLRILSSKELKFLGRKILAAIYEDFVQLTGAGIAARNEVHDT